MIFKKFGEEVYTVSKFFILVFIPVIKASTVEDIHIL